MSPTGPSRSVVVHAHFYQPPREDPWLELVEREPNAAPAHDWNERIDQECYRVVLAARLQSSTGGIRGIVNTLESISFDVGPTLLDWLERESPSTYQGMLAADRVSAGRLGHGNAMAMPYHHIILPLASRRDKIDEVRFGIADFRRRFGREPDGMWLPETAVDHDTLEVLAAEGIAFTVLAPHQVEVAPPHGLPGRYQTSQGRSIAVFVYDGSLSHDVAFGPLIRNADAWAGRLLGAPRPASPSLTAIATDGETYGHHHKFGEMALAAVLDRVSREGSGLWVENFATFLARHPAAHDVTLAAPSSWSCAHGVERWRSDCGCRMEPDTTQAWRTPLRDAVDWLTDELQAVYDAEALRFFPEPAEARTAYALTGAPVDVPAPARELLEMARNTSRIATSCGWFFDDVAGLETTQILKYAARAIELAGSDGARLADGFRLRLEPARSNDPSKGTAADIFDAALPRWPADARVAAGFAATAALCPDRARSVVGAYLVGAAADGGVQVRHRRTGHTEEYTAVVHRSEGFGIDVELTNRHAPRTVTVPVHGLPEREQALVREVLRREALRQVLTSEDLVQLAHGSVGYGEALRSAVIRLVPEHRADATAAAAARLQRALDLLALEGMPVPYDAQTRFHRVVHRGGAAPAFAALAGRMGFTPDAMPPGLAE